MFASDFPLHQTLRIEKNYTTASTLKKPKSLIAELLFGVPCEKRVKTPKDHDIVEHIEYVFEPGQVFGFAYKSLGPDFKKLNQCFILRALRPNEEGAVVPGIYPGAEILLSTTSATSSLRFRDILQRLQNSRIDLVTLKPEHYSYLHRLLDAKLSTDYFIAELINQFRK